MASGWGLLLSFLAPPLLWLLHLSGQLLLEALSCFLESLSASPLDIHVSVSWHGVGNSFKTVLTAGLNTPLVPLVKLPCRAAGPQLTLGTHCIWEPSVMKSLEKASCLLVKRPQQLPSKLAQADYLLQCALQGPSTSLPPVACGLGLLWVLQVVSVSICGKGLKALLYTCECARLNLSMLFSPRFVPRVP